ncbi:hypothetical protein Tco_1344029, partial [Tanacetum coccineum]
MNTTQAQPKALDDALVAPALIDPPLRSNEDYDEEREMEPRPEPRREATPTLWLRSLGICRQREKVVGFKDAPNGEGNRRGRNAEGIRSSEIEARE